MTGGTISPVDSNLKGHLNMESVFYNSFYQLKKIHIKLYKRVI